jgi:tRNA(Ile)-lysidine synthase
MNDTQDNLSLAGRVAVCIDQAELLGAGEAVVVAVSGGLDSVVLLDVLASLAGQAGRGYRLTVAHLDHWLREGSSDDAAFVTEQAGRYGLACDVEAVDVAALAERLGEGTEHAARSARYEFLARVAAARNASAVAVGHHADDQVETILFRLFRGTALRGLAGMARSRPMGEAGGVRLIRPLLDFPRAELDAYARSRGLTWREDPSNASSDHSRNVIRHELLPLVREQLNPAADEAVLRLAARADAVERFVSAEARAWLERSVSLRADDRILLDAGVLAAADEAVRTAAVYLALEELGIGLRDLSAEHLRAIDALLVESAGAVNLPCGFRAVRRGSQLLLLTPQADA